MRMIIHDLPAQESKTLSLRLSGDTHIIFNNGAIRRCIGCFGCWLKTPGTCVIKDGYENIGKLFSHCGDLILISACVYGGFSPFVKNVLDRGSSYVLPYFTTRNKEMHHKCRYDNIIDISAYFYGADITGKEKETAVNLVKANAVNYAGNVKGIYFYNSAAEIKEALA